MALNGCRVTRQNLDTLLGALQAGVPVTCHYFRHDLLGQTRLTLVSAPAQTASLQPRPGATAQARRRAWLGSST